MVALKLFRHSGPSFADLVPYAGLVDNGVILLKDGSLIQLPAIAEDSALIQLDQLDQRQRILDLGFARIDLRDPDMVAVRPRDAALPGQQLAADGA